MAHPILYSLRNCPYAMRARIAIFKSHQAVALRDVVLTDKPAAMILASPKATVPILVLDKNSQFDSDNAADVKEFSAASTVDKVIDESLDIMLWALKKSDPNNLLHSDNTDTVKSKSKPNEIENEKLNEMLALITEFDVEFKQRLEAYKCAKRYHETNLNECRAACEYYIQLLESRLSQHDYLFSRRESLADIALLPFIRQFARIERQWYLQSPYPKLKNWLNRYLQSPMFTKVMVKHRLWLECGEEVIFVGK
ncbi:glutathione S-transferase [Colwellia sp. C1TZA3]|uniref:glutathione S-transferase n=1 Tax=Colwellia sp. C1TZA3 TaxID=2508879 RepID=UPI0011B99C29|nr:glutathione S-transferase [Colwellia sp. C1TZA3]TWX65098.1 glutathione S-transferase [Colwellia sp. C1TZA3]